MHRGMDSVLQSRLKMQLREKKVTARTASLAATGKPDTIRDILRGKVKSPQAQTIKKLADYFEVTTEFLTTPAPRVKLAGNSSASLVPARVLGSVQAGAFMEPDADDRFSDGDPKFVPTIRDPDFPGVEQIAFEIAGDSIDKVCVAGGFAICLPFIETGLAIKSGMWVVVDRTRGGLLERTIKQVKGERGAYTLHPSSTNPKHKPISFPSAEPAEEVTIFAVVRRFISPTLRW